MAHPIFDRSTFAWDRQEAEHLYEMLVASIPQPPEITQLYAQAGGDPGSLTPGQAARDTWREALELLAGIRALRRLCEDVLPGVLRLQGTAPFQAALRAVVGATPAVEQRIISGIPVLDRRPLRSLVTALQSDVALRVLLVRGEPKTGKTHGRHVFQAAAADSGAKAVYLYAPMVATVDDVVGELFSALGAVDAVPDRDTTGPAWYGTVCRKLGEVADAKNTQLWVAVDDLGAASEPDGAPLLDPQIAAFCGQFVLHMPNPAFGQWFRLMLIHYPPGPVPTRWLRDVWREDEPTTADVQKQDVEDYLRDWGLENDRKFVEDELAALAEDVIAKVDGPTTPEEAAVPRLQRLHDSLTETLRGSTGGGGP
ncbi:MAG TPA: hypothetical protein VFO26_06205 [Gaiella sp.]|uniref:hypothetical protein n=1 Tax=Gaiella sp. TaxID=2663207 RepID=UPI002D7E94D5|nr:hypothetical protein [Gaiella sp.]HET9287134.1 hypothetical protein [Gaiella sp.]